MPEHARLAFVTYAPTAHPRRGQVALLRGATCSPPGCAKERGFDEALLVTPHGRVLEAPTSTIFWCTGDGVLATPPLDEHILASITRAHVIEADRRRGARVHAGRPARGERGVPGLNHARGAAGRAIEDIELAAPGERTQGGGRRPAGPDPGGAGGGRLARRVAYLVAHVPGEVPSQVARDAHGAERTTDDFHIAEPWESESQALSATGRSSSRPRPFRAGCASTTTRCSSTRASTTTTSCRGSSSRSSACRRRTSSSASARGTNTDADRADAGGARAACSRARPGPGARLRRHELHARRRAGGGAGAAAARARRGRHALVRPRDAGGAEPRPDRPRERPAALLDRDRGGEPGAASRVAGAVAPGRRRDGRRVAGVRADRGASARARSRSTGVEPGELPARDRPPRRATSTTRSGSSGSSTLLEALPVPVVLPAPPAHARSASTRPACAGGSSRPAVP